MYASLKGLTSKGKKRDKEEARVSYAAAVEQQQDISIKIPTQSSQHSSKPPGNLGPRLHNLPPFRVDARTSSPHTSIIAIESAR
jgi:hypothetical protein